MAGEASEREAEGAEDAGGREEEAGDPGRVEILIEPDHETTKAEAGLLLLQECRNLLEEIRDALVPAVRTECPACGSTHVQRYLHRREVQCSRGVCIRWMQATATDPLPHWLCECGDCSEFWVEEADRDE